MILVNRIIHHMNGICIMSLLLITHMHKKDNVSFFLPSTSSVETTYEKTLKHKSWHHCECPNDYYAWEKKHSEIGRYKLIATDLIHPKIRGEQQYGHGEYESDGSLSWKAIGVWTISWSSFILVVLHSVCDVGRCLVIDWRMGFALNSVRTRINPVIGMNTLL